VTPIAGSLNEWFYNAAMKSGTFAADLIMRGKEAVVFFIKYHQSGIADLFNINYL
jgi:hypothetical protein